MKHDTVYTEENIIILLLSGIIISYAYFCLNWVYQA